MKNSVAAQTLAIETINRTQREGEHASRDARVGAPASGARRIALADALHSLGNPLRDHFSRDTAVDIGEPKITSGIAIREPLVIDPQLMQQRRVQVVHVDFPLQRLKAELVGGTKRKARPEAATSQPHGKAHRVVVTTGAIVLRVGRSSKLAAPPDDRVFQKPTLFQVGE